MMRAIVTILIVIILQPNSINSQCVSFRNTQYKLSGTNCGQRCAERNLKNPTCTSTNSAGCFCKAGYFRDSTWNCVPGQKCDSQRSRDSNKGDAPKVKPDDCPPNEQFSECGNYCTERCRNTNDKHCPLNTCDVGCFCIDGYFRKDDGQCVPQSKCGIKMKSKGGGPPQTCPFGEHYEKCAMRCKETCGASKLSGCKGEKCEPGCFCKNGFARNVNGDCVPRRDCKGAGSCKRNEVFRLCDNHCAELCDPPPECPGDCKPGCFCKNGYLRNNRGKCVSDGSKIRTGIAQRVADRFGLLCERVNKNKDPQKGGKGIKNMSGAGLGGGGGAGGECGKNEIHKKCGNACGESCDTIGQDYTCPKRKICKIGCFCVKGFYKNSKGNCVSADQCKSGKGSKELKKRRKKLKKSCNPDTEEYRECDNHCVELCGPPTVCPNECEMGCFCKQGLFRTGNGECVPENECPALPKPPRQGRPLSCGKSEKFFECRKDCLQNCNEIIDKMVCPIRQKCLYGCLCMKGYYRNSIGECVSDKLCMADKNNKDVEPRKKKKKVVIPDCSDNEEYLTCGNYCIELCKPPKKKCTKQCKNGCFCKQKYFRNAKGRCVKESKCEGKREKHKIKLRIKDKCIKDNEVLKDCGYSCGQTCKEQSKHIACPKRLACEPGCYCIPGHFRNNNDECVPIDKCVPKVGKFKPKTTTEKPKPPQPECKEHEEYDDCGDTCIELCKPPDSCETSCEPGCYCESGYYRAEKGGACVPEDECPKEEESKKFKLKIKLKCEENQIYSECGTRCGQMCVDLFKSVICPKKGLCVGGCFCKPGYYRNENGKCVLESQCPDNREPPEKPPKCDDNEEYQKCGDRCKQSCETLLKKSECPEKQCSAGCFCVEGFYKDPYGNCVADKDCTDPMFPALTAQECGKNEKFNLCGNRCGQACEELVQNRTCSEMRSCVSGCFCDKGFRRSDNGVCVPEDDCYTVKTEIKFEIKCEENEEYSKCEVRCGQACDDLGRKVECPKSRQCASGCFCKEGNFRNEIGDCVPENECPDVGPPNQIPKKIDCGPNEEYSECGSKCGQACDDLGRKTPCPTRRICVSGCFCAEGYFRTYSGECVPMLECPDISPPKRPPPSCDSNEEFNECGKRCGQSCDEFKNEKKCPKKGVCVQGCFCDSDYKRDHKGDCVQEDTCPARDRDELNPESVKCGKNEEYNECGSRCGQGCEDLLYGAECSKRKMCVSGCFCLEGFYRNEIGECVPKEECPSPPSETKSKDCGENERYTDCGSQCGQSCDESSKAVNCPRKRMCMTGCFCKKGFYRDKYENCVSKRQCKSGELGAKKPKSETTERTDEEDSKEDATEDAKEATATESTESSTEDDHSEDGSEASEADSTEDTETTTEGNKESATEGTAESSTEGTTEGGADGTTEGTTDNKSESTDESTTASGEGSTEDSKAAFPVIPVSPDPPLHHLVPVVTLD